MRVLKLNRTLWCHVCEQAVILMPMPDFDCCPDCRAELKPRLEVDYEEADRLCCLVNPVKCLICKDALGCIDHIGEMYIVQTGPTDEDNVCGRSKCKERLDVLIEKEYGPWPKRKGVAKWVHGITAFLRKLILLQVGAAKTFIRFVKYIMRRRSAKG